MCYACVEVNRAMIEPELNWSREREITLGMYKIILLHKYNLNINYKKYNCRVNEYLLLEPKKVKTKELLTMQDQDYGIHYPL